MKAEEVMEAALLVQEFNQLSEMLMCLNAQDKDSLGIAIGYFAIYAGPVPSQDAAREIRMIMREDFMKRQNVVRERLRDLKIDLQEGSDGRRLN